MFRAVFPPSISLAADPPTGPIYESTAYQLICTATVNTTIVNTPVNASVVWTDPRGMTIPDNNPRRRVELALLVVILSVHYRSYLLILVILMTMEHIPVQ